MHCKNCGKEVNEDAAFCPKCGESLTGKFTGWQELQIKEEIDEAERTSTNHGIYAIVLALIGIIGGVILFLFLNPACLLGVVLVGFAVYYAFSSERHGNKANRLKKQLK